MGMSTLAVKPEGRWRRALLQLLREKIISFSKLDMRLATSIPGRNHTGLPASSSQRYQPAAVTLDTAGKLKLEQDCAHDCRRGAREPDEVVDGYRSAPRKIAGSRLPAHWHLGNEDALRENLVR